MSLSISAANSGYNPSLLSGIGATIGAIGGFIAGGPAGAAAGITLGQQVGNAFGGGGSTPPANPIPKPPIIGAGGGISVGGYGINIGGTFTGPSSGAAGTGVMTAGCGVKGYHLNKKPLGVTKRHGALPAHSVYVRNRHMNAGNAHAARRAISRLKSAHKIFKKIDKIVGRHSCRRAPGRKR